MKKIEKRYITVYYCDFCKKEIKGKIQELHLSTDTNSGMHLCQTIHAGEKHNCVVKFMKKIKS